jgi:hypothetical protein
VQQIGSSTANTITIIICVFNLIEVSYNQPKLPPCACWNSDGITFDTTEVVGLLRLGLFVGRNNTVYVADYVNNRVQVWGGGSTTVTKTIFDTLPHPNTLFVNIDGDIYVGSDSVKTVEKWTINETKSVVAMNVSNSCWGLFVDIAHNLYCSLQDEHRVVKQSPNAGINMFNTVAGNSSRGSASHMLTRPRGIFVDVNSNLYVADCGNNRIQLFEVGQLNGITKAGKDATLSITLRCPTSVFLDLDDNIFIVDQSNHRIIGSTPNGFYCLTGCSSISGATPSKLDSPSTAAFDSYGNIFVADPNSNRIQKFMLMANTFGK